MARGGASRTDRWPRQIDDDFQPQQNEITLLTPRSHTYRQLEATARRPSEPTTGVALKRGNDGVIAGKHCSEWSWTEELETHTVCTTADGALLRLVIDGQTIMQARSVSYGPQRLELFQMPPDYTPALAPEGGPSD